MQVVGTLKLSSVFGPTATLIPPEARSKPDSIPKFVGVFPVSNIPMLLQSMTLLDPLNLALEMVTPLSKRMFLTNESAVQPFKVEASVTMNWA